MSNTVSITYCDHVQMWTDELRSWVPDAIFDAHLHLSPPSVIGAVSETRRRQPLAAFIGFTWRHANAWYRRLYEGKRIVGVAAFPLPMREVNVTAANRYVAHLARRRPELAPFMLCDPRKVKRVIAQFSRALRRGLRFRGVKPYYDLLGKSNYETTMDEVVPRSLLEFMQYERLALMLHTTGAGVGDKRNHDYLKRMADAYPAVTIILAHMGRYLNPSQFACFVASGVMDRPSIYVESSSASRPEVYAELLADRQRRKRLLFGSDLPYGLIPGVEAWSHETGPVYVVRRECLWFDAAYNRRFGVSPESCSYNTYHVLKALKDAVSDLGLQAREVEDLKRDVFSGNALRIFGTAA